ARLDAKLPEILSGELQPTGTAERLALAGLCQLPCRRLYAAATRFYREAFADPKFVNDLAFSTRHEGACASAPAGSGQGKDADQLDANEYARLRNQGLAWLRADLTEWKERLDSEPANSRAAVSQNMRSWRQDSDFNGVRDRAALSKLPQAEGRKWE